MFLIKDKDAARFLVFVPLMLEDISQRIFSSKIQYKYCNSSCCKWFPNNMILSSETTFIPSLFLNSWGRGSLKMLNCSTFSVGNCSLLKENVCLVNKILLERILGRIFLNRTSKTKIAITENIKVFLSKNRSWFIWIDFGINNPAIKIKNDIPIGWGNSFTTPLGGKRISSSSGSFFIWLWSWFGLGALGKTIPFAIFLCHCSAMLSSSDSAERSIGGWKEAS